MKTWIATITAASSDAVAAAQAITAASSDAAILAAAEKCKAARNAAHLDALPAVVAEEIASWRRNQDPTSGRNRQGHPGCDGPEDRAALAKATDAACGFAFPRGASGLRRAWGSGCPVPEALHTFQPFAAAETLGRVGSALERCLETWPSDRLTWQREILDWVTPRLAEIAAASGVQAARRRLTAQA